MKRCPECRRDYYDDSLLYCLDDGAELLEGPASMDEPATAILPEAQRTGEAQTRALNTESALPAKAGSKRNSIIAGTLGILIVAALAIGGYIYFGRPESEISSIAVLPFVNESGDQEIEYLSDGMTETLINNLSQIPKLSVKARSSVFRYKGQNVEPQKVAADLSVQAVLNGRVVQRGEQLTLSLDLVDARTGDHIWGEQYNRKLTDVIALQSEIARDVSNKLRTRLSGADAQKVTKSHTANPEAYQLYLQGRYFWNKRNGNDIRKSLDYFQKAIDKDPTYALAYAGLADAYAVLPSYTNDTAHEFQRKARAAATKALELDESLAEPHATLASVMFEYDWNFAESEKEFKRAIELNPSYATAHHWYAEYLLALNRDDEAFLAIKRAQAEDPLSLIINGIVGIVHFERGEHDLSITQLKRTVEMDPNFPRTHLFLADVYAKMGMFEESIDEQEKLLVLLGMPRDDVARAAASLRSELKRSGKNGYLRKQLEFIKASRFANPNFAPPLFVVASIHAQLGETEQAFAMLERSYEQREPDLIRLKRERRFDPIRSDPRFADLIRRIGFPQ